MMNRRLPCTRVQDLYSQSKRLSIDGTRTETVKGEHSFLLRRGISQFAFVFLLLVQRWYAPQRSLHCPLDHVDLLPLCSQQFGHG